MSCMQVFSVLDAFRDNCNTSIDVQCKHLLLLFLYMEFVEITITETRV